MTANVIPFPRKKPLSDHEFPEYWSFVAKRCYEMQIERGDRHENAFLEWDLQARLPEGRLVFPRMGESFESYIARLDAVAIGVSEAHRACRVRQEVSHG